jgi:hypothetical protein
MRDERRVKLVEVRARDVLDWFAGAVKGWPRFVELPHIEGLPPDATVENVRENHLTKCFEFVVSHPSFDPVPDFHAIPRVTKFTEYRVAELVRASEVTIALPYSLDSLCREGWERVAEEQRKLDDPPAEPHVVTGGE